MSRFYVSREHFSARAVETHRTIAAMKRRLARFVLFLGLSLAAVLAWLRTFWLVLAGEEEPQERALRGLDQFGNAGWLDGSNHETISSHLGRLLEEDAPLWARLVGGFINLLDPGHCERAADDEAPLLAAIEKVLP